MPVRDQLRDAAAAPGRRDRGGSRDQRLYAFIAERAASEDYRRQLGLIATIRPDFERLARLQEQWRNDKDGDSPRPIDRIVLYIDDLDRCTPRQVVEVLQAAHLLLALDLFVVVGGVDPRWLLHSLRDQYRSTLTAQPPGAETARVAEGAAAETSRERGSGPAQEDADRLMLSTPHDYPEKIFNVPFVLPTMTPEGFDTMIRRLSITEADSHDKERGPSLVETAPAPPDNGTTVMTGTHLPPRVEEGSEIAAVQHGDTVVPTPLTESELQALSSLAPLITANPRLLGQILFAPPHLEERLMGGICRRTVPNSWGEFLNGLRPRCVDECWRNDVCDDMSERDRAEWELLVECARPASALVTLPDLTTFKTWAPHVARFSFLLAPVTSGDRSRASSGKPDEVLSELR